MSQRNDLRRIRALWAVKWSISPPSKDSGVSIQSDDDDEVTLDLAYQQEIISNETEDLLPPLDSLSISNAPLRNERNSIYEEAENFLQRVLEEYPEVMTTESTSPVTSPQISSHAPPPVGLNHLNPLEDEENDSSSRSSILYSPPQHRISVRMQRYLSESENCSPFVSEEP
jgi:hypothetical protein